MFHVKHSGGETGATPQPGEGEVVSLSLELPSTYASIQVVATSEGDATRGPLSS